MSLEAETTTTTTSTTKSMLSSDDELIQYCQQFITCDSCGAGQPKLRCSRCQLVFYCNRQCQAKDWKEEHKASCIPIDKMRKDLVAFGSGRPSSTSTTPPMPLEEPNEEIRIKVLQEHPECAICLEQPMIRPIVLDKCHHAYCFPCLQHWSAAQTRPRLFFGPTTPRTRRTTTQGGGAPTGNDNDNDDEEDDDDYDSLGSSTRTSTCPLCRQEIPNMTEAIIQDTVLLLSSAQKQDASESFIQEQCTKALAKMELLKQVQQAAINNTKVAARYHHQLLAFEYAIHLLHKDYHQALMVAKQTEQELKVAVQNGTAIEQLLQQIDDLGFDSYDDEETDRLMEQLETLYRNPYTSTTVHVDAALQVARVQVLQNDWEGVKATYQDILSIYPDQPGSNDNTMTPQQCREIFSGMSRCAYELGKYDIAIDVGLAAITMNRYFPGSHEYVVLACLASPPNSQHYQKAEQYAAEAVIYEAPWDDQHRAKIKDFFRTHFVSKDPNESSGGGGGEGV